MARGLFADYPCEAPCWHGLEPGQSTENDVLVTLRSLTFIDAGSIRETAAGCWDATHGEEVEAKLIDAECTAWAGRRCLRLLLAGDNLKMIILFPGQSTTFQDAVAHLGKPDFVQLLRFRGPKCEIRLVWIHRQVIVEHTDPSSTTLCEEGRLGAKIDPNLAVHSVTFILPDDIQLTSIPESKRDFPWPGFAEP